MARRLALLSLALASCARAPLFEGEWIGDYRLGETAAFCRLLLERGADGWRGTMDLTPAPGAARTDLTELAIEEPAATFGLVANGERLSFAGELAGGEIHGTVAAGAARGTFRLVRTAPNGVRSRFGTYRGDDGRLLWVGRFEEFGHPAFLLDWDRLQLSPLYASGADTLLAGATLGAGFFPTVAGARADGDSLRLTRADGTTLTATRLDLRAEVTRFAGAGGTPLAGLLTLPAVAPPYPAVVLLHGSGPEDRDYLGPWISFFASRGIAVLAYDKRGVRDSGGDWRTATLEDLADDARGGLALLRQRADIDPRRIGLMGFSQGGWIAPIVAARETDLAFIVLHAGAAVTPGRQGLDALAAELGAWGFPDEEIRAARDYYALNDDVTRGGSDIADLRSAYEAAAGRGVEWLVEPPQPLDHWFRRMARGMIDFDPLPHWRSVRCPVLAFFGSTDRTVPPEPSAGLLAAALRAAGNEDFDIVVVPGANHLMLAAETGLRPEYARLSRFSAGYFDRLEAWLAARL